MSPRGSAARRVRQAQERFLDFFPDGFRDSVYEETERAPKWQAHREWLKLLSADQFAALLRERRFRQVATAATRLESRTYLLFSFEKMALRDAVKTPGGARQFAMGLYDWLYGPGSERDRFARWVETVGSLPRRQTRVRTWPVVTIFGFIARPKTHMYVKPTVMRAAAERYGYDLRYQSTPDPETYADMLRFARTVRRDLAALRPRDLIDIQSFLWVLGSTEYD